MNFQKASYRERYDRFVSEWWTITYQAFINRLNWAKPRKSMAKEHALHKIICWEYAAKQNVLTTRINANKWLDGLIDMICMPKMSVGKTQKDLLRIIKREGLLDEYNSNIEFLKERILPYLQYSVVSKEFVDKTKSLQAIYWQCLR